MATSIFSKLRVLLFLLIPSALWAAPSITVSASAVTLLGSSQSISITVQLIDPFNTGMLKVSGTGIVPIMRASTVTPGTTATVGPIYGNDVILNGFGVANNTYYLVQVFTFDGTFISSTPALQNFYAFTGSGTIDLATATPLVPNFMNSSAGVSIPGNLTVSGTGTFNSAVTTQTFNAGLWVGPGAYSTIAAAVTAAGVTNPTSIFISSAYAGTECGALQSNITYFDFRGGPVGGCPNNSTNYDVTSGTGTGATPAMIKVQATFTSTPSLGSVISFWPITICNNCANGSNVIDGSSTEALVTGTLPGTVSFVTGDESPCGILSNGGTVTNCVGVQGYGKSTVGGTTATTNVMGIEAIGCNGFGTFNAQTWAPATNCYGGLFAQQFNQASGRNYGWYSQTVNLLGYDSFLGFGGIDMENISNVAKQFIRYNSSGLAIFAVDTNGIKILDSASVAHVNISSSGVRLGDGTAATAGVDINSDLKLESNNRYAPNEGTCSAGIAAFDMVCANSTDHALTLSNNGGAYGHVLATGNLDAKGVQTKRGVAGCTTAASIGGVCATAITVTWTTAFADTSYTVICSPTGAPTNLPSTPYVSAKAAGSVTVNYFAITAAAASWATIDCTAVHD